MFVHTTLRERTSTPVHKSHMDYFQILDISRNADSEQINKSFRKLALKNHPLKNNNETREVFESICEAYHILSNHEMRSVYELYGMKGLKEGVAPHEHFPGFKGYIYSEKAEDVFMRFFGGVNPFTDFFSVEYLPSISELGTKSQEKSIDSSKESVQVTVTLEELYKGCLKRVNLSDGTFLNVNIQQGWMDGQVLSYKQTSKECLVTLKQEKHELFEREGKDLIYKKRIGLLDALVGGVVEVKMLDGRVLNIPLSEVVCPGYVKVVRGEGMPDGKGGKGNLKMVFDVEYPTYFSEEQKGFLRVAFQGV